MNGELTNGELTPRDPKKPWMRISSQADGTTGHRIAARPNTDAPARRAVLDTEHLLAYMLGDVLIIYVHDDLLDE